MGIVRNINIGDVNWQQKNKELVGLSRLRDVTSFEEASIDLHSENGYIRRRRSVYGRKGVTRGGRGY